MMEGIAPIVTRSLIVLFRHMLPQEQEYVLADLRAFSELRSETLSKKKLEHELILALHGSPKFRSIYYYRAQHSKNPRVRRDLQLLARCFPPHPNVELHCDDIGPGFCITHPPCVIGSCPHVGRDVSVGPGVVVGKRHGKAPIIEDGVHICANATVIGGITLGHDAIVGAGSVVLHDVPPYGVVAGNPAVLLHYREGHTGVD